MKAVWVAGSSVKERNALAFGKEISYLLWAGKTAANAHLFLAVTFPNEVHLCSISLHGHQSLNTVIQEYFCLEFLQRS